MSSQLDTWEPHLGAVYQMACVLLGNHEAAKNAVVAAVLDVSLAPLGSATPEETLRTLSRHVFWHSQFLTPEPATRRPRQLPPTMTLVGRLAQLQRTCLALCFYGGHTHRQVAALLGVPPDTVAQALTSGLRELAVLNPPLPDPGDARRAEPAHPPKGALGRP